MVPGEAELEVQGDPFAAGKTNWHHSPGCEAALGCVGVNSVPGEGWEEELRWGWDVVAAVSVPSSVPVGLCPLAALTALSHPEWGGMGSAP